MTGPESVAEELKEGMTGKHEEGERESVGRREQANSRKILRWERKVVCLKTVSRKGRVRAMRRWRGRR